MKCNEVRNLALAYLDSELDAKTSQEIQLHLQSCSECAQIFEHEEKFNERLFGVLRAGQSNPALWEKVESQLRPGTGVAGIVRRWKLVAIGGFAALFIVGLAAGIVLWVGGGSSLDLARVVEKDHREFLQGKVTSEFTGGVPDEIVRKMGGRLDAAAFSKVPTAGGFRSEGARLCHVDGVPVAWTMGRCKDVPVSLIVFKKSELEHFPKTQERLATGEPIVCTRTGRFQFAVRVAGDHVVCAIADTSKRMLEDLLKSIPGAGRELL